jgi:8-oxo-dGTP pyrophosphatase MutT (NUDIX family)
VTAATWACLRHRRLLVVRPHGQDAFFLPGGMPEPGETLQQTTVREVAEEVGIELRPDDLTLFAQIVTAAHGRPGTDVRLVCFLAPSDAVPAAIGEIAEVEWITAADAGRCAAAIRQVITRLVEAGLMDDHAAEERRLAGGNTGGAVRIGDTVRRVPGHWTPSVHAVLRHLEAAGFDRAPRALGFDDQGREVLSFLPGDVVGDARPWPGWVHGDEALRQVGGWLRDLHDAVAGFTPAPDATWREGGAWRPGLIIGHNDAAPYNAAWSAERLAGFFDWDFAAPVTPEWDLAFTAFAWVPLHARHVVAAEGFTAFADRPRRLRLFLDAYGWTGPLGPFIEIVRERVAASARSIRRTAAAGDPAYRRMIEHGVDAALDTAVSELADFPHRQP